MFSLFQLEAYIRDETVTPANRYFAQCYQQMAAQGKFAIQPSPVLRFYNNPVNKTQVYSIQPIGPITTQEETDETDLSSAKNYEKWYPGSGELD